MICKDGIAIIRRVRNEIAPARMAMIPKRYYV